MGPQAPSRVPRTELHLHLDISMSYRVASALAPGLTPAAYQRRLQGPLRCTDLAAFLATTTAQIELLQTANALRLLTCDVIAQLVAEDVQYAELRFCPLLHTAGGLSPEEALESVLGAARKATTDATVPIRVGIVLTTLRHFSAAQSVRVAQLALRYRTEGVVGFDLGGDETGFRLESHLPAFDLVRSEGLAHTVHAGEAGGPESVREVLDALAPPRIGHGVRSIEDPDLIERLRHDGVHLEMCPTCNVQLGVVSSIERHPIDRLLRNGVSLSVSTDSRTSTVTTLTHEYQLLRKAFGWTDATIATTNAMAAAAAFGADADPPGAEAGPAAAIERSERHGGQS